MAADVRRADVEALLRFTPCPQCTYDFLTGEGTRSCSYYECPYLPEGLDVRCPTCNYNFLTDDINRACQDDDPCEFAQFEAPQRVANARLWMARHGATEAAR